MLSGQVFRGWELVSSASLPIVAHSTIARERATSNRRPTPWQWDRRWIHNTEQRGEVSQRESLPSISQAHVVVLVQLATSPDPDGPLYISL